MLLVIAILIWIAIERLLGRARRSALGQRAAFLWSAVREGERTGARPSARPISDQLVRCSSCGVHVPRSRTDRQLPEAAYLCESCRSERAVS